MVFRPGVRLADRAALQLETVAVWKGLGVTCENSGNILFQLLPADYGTAFRASTVSMPRITASIWAAAKSANAAAASSGCCL